jgi:hypothetical protein
MGCIAIINRWSENMAINYPVHLQERFARLLEQRAVQAKRAKAVAELVELEHAERGPLSPAAGGVRNYNNDLKRS